MTRNEIEKLYDELLRAEEKTIDDDTKRAVEEYNKKKRELRDSATEQARRLYSAYTRSVTDLPAQLARMGITGGAAETRALKLRNGYVNSTAELERNVLNQSAALDGSAEAVRQKAVSARTEARARNATDRLNAILKAEGEARAAAKAQKELEEAERKRIEAETEKAKADAKRNETQEVIDLAVEEAIEKARKEWIREVARNGNTEYAPDEKQMLSMVDIVRPYAHLVDKNDTQLSLKRKLMLEVGPQKADGFARALIQARKRGLL